jgi:hypothetical protein
MNWWFAEPANKELGGSGRAIKCETLTAHAYIDVDFGRLTAELSPNISLMLHAVHP